MIIKKAISGNCFSLQVLILALYRKMLKGKHRLNLHSPLANSCGCMKTVPCKDTAHKRISFKPGWITPLWLHTVWLKSRQVNRCDDRKEHRGGCKDCQLSEVRRVKRKEKSSQTSLTYNRGFVFITLSELGWGGQVMVLLLPGLSRYRR